MAKVMVFGTFDCLHKGHLDFFRQAREHAEFLISVVARDSTVEKLKGKLPSENEHKRLLNVYNSPEVSLAVLGSKNDPYTIIEEHKPDIICLGYDQDSFNKGLDEALEKIGISPKIITLKPYMADVYKSSKMNLQ